MTKKDKQNTSESKEHIEEVLHPPQENNPKKEAPKEEPQEWKKKYIRLYAEFENSRKRLQREQLNISLMANKNLILDLLPTLDNLERAIEDLKKNNTKEETQKGFTLILTNLYNTLEKKGLKAMNVEIGQEPNPQEHQILNQTPTQNPKLKGKITQIVNKGYFLHHVVLRHAQVIIGT